MTDIQKHNFRLLRARLRGVPRAERLQTYAVLRAPFMLPLIACLPALLSPTT